MIWPRKLLPSPVPRTDEHVSIWSVAARDARTALGVARALWLVALATIVYNASEGWAAGAGAVLATRSADFVLGVLEEFAAVAVALAVVAVLAARALNLTGDLLMSLYQAIVNRWVIPVIEEHRAQGRAEGLDKGRAEGLDQGRAETQAQWQAWNARRLAAERTGTRFTEAPPA